MMSVFVEKAKKKIQSKENEFGGKTDDLGRWCKKQNKKMEE